MRPRVKKNLYKRLDVVSDVLVDNPAELKGMWKGDYKEVALEIGCGKGSFICGMAEKNPDIMFVGIECVKNVIVMAAEKAVSKNLPNVKLISGNARSLDEYFGEAELDRLYLNFSDPWPKSRNEMNRLTSDTYMPLYIKLLKDGGHLVQKTDNRPLFDYSVEVYKSHNCEFAYLSYDYHSEPDYTEEGPSGNVVTEYESRFMGYGTPICKADVVMLDRETSREIIEKCTEALAKRNRIEAEELKKRREQNGLR